MPLPWNSVDLLPARLLKGSINPRTGEPRTPKGWRRLSAFSRIKPGDRFFGTFKRGGSHWLLTSQAGDFVYHTGGNTYIRRLTKRR